MEQKKNRMENYWKKSWNLIHLILISKFRMSGCCHSRVSTRLPYEEFQPPFHSFKFVYNRISITCMPSKRLSSDGRNIEIDWRNEIKPEQQNIFGLCCVPTVSVPKVPSYPHYLPPNNMACRQKWNSFEIRFQHPSQLVDELSLSSESVHLAMI